MSVIQINNSQNSNTELQNINPLNRDTNNTLKKYVFHSKISGGCLAYQTFAKRITYLKDLNNKFQAGSIDLGKKDRMWAIAKCIGATLLTAAVVSTIVVIILSLTIPLIQFYSPHLFGMGIGLGLGGSFACCLHAYSSTQEVFSRPTPEELKKELQLSPSKQLSQKNTMEMKSVEQKLQTLINEMDNSIITASQIGDDSFKTVQGKKKAKIELALQDVQRLRIAVSGND